MQRPLALGFLLPVALALSCRSTSSTGPDEFSAPRLIALPAVPTTGGKGAETIGVQKGSGLLAVSNSRKGTVEVFDLSRPATPRSLRVLDLELEEGEEVTCVAVHPFLDRFLVVVRAEEPSTDGRAQLHRLSDGERLESVSVGIEPDSVYFDPTGRYALVANEAESFHVNPLSGQNESGDGSLTLIAFDGRGRLQGAILIPLPDATGISGLVQPSHARTIERDVGSETVQVPLTGNQARFLEPEVVAFSHDGRRAVVTLQENNGVVLIDVPGARIEAVLGLGLTSHLADQVEDGVAKIDEPFTALREPDGVAFTPDGRFFVTADEGDTDPKASKTLAGLPRGGGRTLSVFDASSGQVMGDTGAQLALRCVEAGCYPDARSDSKGSEPEMVVTFEERGRAYALLTLERADAMALVDLGDPSSPRVLGVAPTLGPGPHAPEGLVHFADRAGRHFGYSANEESGDLGVFRVDF